MCNVFTSRGQPDDNPVPVGGRQSTNPINVVITATFEGARLINASFLACVLFPITIMRKSFEFTVSEFSWCRKP